MKLIRKSPVEQPLVAIETDVCATHLEAPNGVLVVTGDKLGFDRRSLCHMREIPEFAEALLELHRQWESGHEAD